LYNISVSFNRSASGISCVASSSGVPKLFS
jgi:hypothetical protein